MDSTTPPGTGSGPTLGPTPCSTSGSDVSLLAGLEATMERVDLGGCSSEELTHLARGLHAGQRRLDGFLARVAAAARALEVSGQGSAAADVVGSGGDVSRGRAQQLVDRAGVAAQLPEVGADLVAGEACGENVDVIARRSRRLSPEEQERLSAVGGEVAERARSLPPDLFNTYFGGVVRGITAIDDDVPSEAERQRAASKLAMGRHLDGMWWLKASFDSERGAEVQALIEQLASESASEDRVTPNLRAAGLHRGLRRPAKADEGRSDDGGLEPSTRLGVGYIVDADTLRTGPGDQSVAQTWAGESVDPAAVGRLACDADCYAVLLDRLGQPRAVGRTRRRATREQRLQLRALYPGCPLDGTPFDQCEVHHVNVPWEEGGETELDNLLPISIEWHHRIHDRGWTLKMGPDRSLRLWRPDGRLERSIGPPTPITRTTEPPNGARPVNPSE